MHLSSVTCPRVEAFGLNRPIRMFSPAPSLKNGRARPSFRIPSCRRPRNFKFQRWSSCGLSFRTSTRSSPDRRLPFLPSHLLTLASLPRIFLHPSVAFAGVLFSRARSSWSAGARKCANGSLPGMLPGDQPPLGRVADSHRLSALFDSSTFQLHSFFFFCFLFFSRIMLPFSSFRRRLSGLLLHVAHQSRNVAHPLPQNLRVAPRCFLRPGSQPTTAATRSPARFSALSILHRRIAVLGQFVSSSSPLFSFREKAVVCLRVCCPSANRHLCLHACPSPRTSCCHQAPGRLFPPSSTTLSSPTSCAPPLSLSISLSDDSRGVLWPPVRRISWIIRVHRLSPLPTFFSLAFRPLRPLPQGHHDPLSADFITLSLDV